MEIISNREALLLSGVAGLGGWDIVMLLLDTEMVMTQDVAK